jgi:hypothetical protein
MSLQAEEPTRAPAAWVKWATGGSLMLLGLYTSKLLWLVGLIIFFVIQAKEMKSSPSVKPRSDASKSRARWTIGALISILVLVILYLLYRYITTGYTTL